ncbi:MAG: VanZ family protein [Spirochaetaceae bacterium]|nr:VanZ family protein [Spirochaetaceae bacterium]
MTVLKREFFRIPDLKSLDAPYMIIDLLLNYFGFIPLGVFLSLTMASTGKFKRNPLLIGTVLISFLFSISIETAQVSMASRDSSLIDLILNTLGGLSGGLIVWRKRDQYL